MHKLRLAALALVFAATGCATEYVLTRTGEISLPARAPNCAFKVLTAPPTGQYQEVGALDLTRGIPPNTIPDFQGAVQPEVCAAGGDAVIAVTNGAGQYIKGTILKLGASTPEEAQKMAAEQAAQDKATAEKTAAAKPAVDPRCAENNPAWATASAAEKKHILDACAAGTGQETATAPAP